MSFAVIAAGGRQVRVEPGELVRVDRLHSAAGEQVTFDRVLLVGSDAGLKVGTPVVAGATVTARVIEERREKKVLIFKKRRTKTFRKMRGHREYFTLVRIEAIEPGS